MDKKSIVNDLYQAAVIISASSWLFNVRQKDIKGVSSWHSAFRSGKHRKIGRIQHFDLENTGKLVAIEAASEMTREYLIKQKILPDHINV